MYARTTEAGYYQLTSRQLVMALGGFGSGSRWHERILQAPYGDYIWRSKR